MLLDTVFGFWGAIALWFIISISFVAKSRVIVPTVATIALLVALHFFTSEGIWDAMKANWLFYTECFGVYLAIGLIWSVIRWYSGCKTLSNLLNDKIDAYKAKNTKKTFHEWFYENCKHEYVEKAQEVIASSFSVSPLGDTSDIIPSASKNKAVISTWMAYWPLDLLCRIFGYWTASFWKFIVGHLTGFYRELAAKAFDSTREKLKDVSVTFDADAK